MWLKDDIHIERIYPDNEFMLACVEKADKFFRLSILPELIGKFYTRPPAVPTTNYSSELPGPSNIHTGVDSSESHTRLYCYCRGPESGNMIACDNPACPIEWFHFDCLKLSASPRTKIWYCPDCRKLNSCKRKRKKSTKSTTCTSQC